MKFFLSVLKLLKMPSTLSIITSVFTVGTLSYLIYFDYQRRHSPEFRRQLRERSTVYEKEQERAAAEIKNQQRSRLESLIEASLTNDPLPTGLQAREQFFIQEVARADELLATGPDGYMEASLAFYRALYVYPRPAELLGVYETTVKPPAVLELVRAMVVVRPPAAIAQIVHDTASVE